MIKRKEALTDLYMKFIKMFPFKQLPYDVRLMIYKFDGVLEVELDGTSPALLQAFKGEHILFREILSEYSQTNTTVDLPPHFDERLSNLSMAKAKFVKHILVVASQGYLPAKAMNYMARKFGRVADRLEHHSKLQTLKFSDQRFFIDPRYEKLLARNRFVWMNIPPLLSLSGESCSLRKVVIQIRCRHEDHPDLTPKNEYTARRKKDRWALVDNMSICLGILPRLEKVTPRDRPEDWFWEADDGTVLHFETLNGREREQRRRELGWPFTCI